MRSSHLLLASVALTFAPLVGCSDDGGGSEARGEAPDGGEGEGEDGDVGHDAGDGEATGEALPPEVDPAPDGLLVRLPFNGNFDDVGHAQHPTEYGADNPVWVADRNGRPGQAIDMSGVRGGLSVADLPFPADSNAMKLSFWFKQAGGQNASDISGP